MSSEEAKEFIQSIIAASAGRLEALSISIIRQKLNEHFGSQDYGCLVTETVDAELAKMAKRSEAVALAVKGALRTGVTDARNSGRPVTVKKKQPPTIMNEQLKTQSRSSRSLDSTKTKSERPKATTRTSEDETKGQQLNETAIELDQNIVENNSANELKNNGSHKRSRPAKYKQPMAESDSSSEKNSSDSEDNSQDHSESEQERKRKKKPPSKQVIHVDPSLILFAGGRDNLTPLEYAHIILDYCETRQLELTRHQTYKTDSTLKELLKERAHCPATTSALLLIGGGSFAYLKVHSTASLVGSLATASVFLGANYCITKTDNIFTGCCLGAIGGASLLGASYMRWGKGKSVKVPSFLLILGAINFLFYTKKAWDWRDSKNEKTTKSQ